MALAILSLVVLILVIVISNVRKINLGIAAMAGAAAADLKDFAGEIAQCAVDSGDDYQKAHGGRLDEQ